MTKRSVMTERQAKILKIIVEEYTKTAQPVGSKTILGFSTIDASSATIRNDCAFLEKEGYLEKVHESSGRIPATSGYRYYVDNLMGEQNVDDIKRKLEALFADRNMSISEILNKSGQILSEMTKLTTVVMGPNFEQERLHKIELFEISNEQALAIFVLSNGHVENKMFSLRNFPVSDLRISIELFNDRLQDTKLTEVVDKFGLIRPVLESQVNAYEQVLKQFAQALSSISKPTYSTHGMQYMLENPEYNNPEKIKSIIQFIESISPFDYYQKKQTNQNHRVTVQIGSEMDDTNDDVAMLSTTYRVNDVQEGGIALVGPKRMEYERLYEILEWINNKIKKNYEEIDE